LGAYPVMNNKNKSDFILFLLIPLAVGALSALFIGTMSYSSFQKPAVSPPSWLFPIVWTILYILMGISSYLIYSSNNAGKTKALTTYGLQLVFNFFWSILFFRYSLYFFAFLWLLALILLIVIMIYQFYKISPLAAYLQIPYLLWCIFAAYLNYGIYRLN
jgi:Tryptophan-rich sensory protein (mitochondrial benzodiazepine receptor homolog)